MILKVRRTAAVPYQLKKWCVASRLRHAVVLLMYDRYTIYKDHITLGDYEIHDGMSLEMY